MNFDLTEEQRDLSNAALQFANSALAPNAAHWDKESVFPKETIREAGAQGFCSLFIPTHVGGLGLGRLESSIIFEQLATGCTTTTAMLTVHNMACAIIASYASHTVLGTWMPDLVSGQRLASYCLTEPGAGSDAASLTTRADRTSTGFVINGTKAFISGAGVTDCLVVMARTSDSAHRGITAFFVPANTPGISYGKPERKMGWRAQPTRMVSFSDVEVPFDYQLGEEGQGFSIAMKALEGGRINIASCSLGTAQSALDLAKNYMLDRHQFGKPIADFQALQFKLADMNTELVAARQLTRLAAFKYDQGCSQAPVYCAMAKRMATDVGFQVCNEALQIHGGYGYIQDYPLERHVRDVRVHQILEGTNEIMRVIIARYLLTKSEQIL